MLLLIRLLPPCIVNCVVQPDSSAGRHNGANRQTALSVAQ